MQPRRFVGVAALGEAARPTLVTVPEGYAKTVMDAVVESGAAAAAAGSRVSS